MSNPNIAEDGKDTQFGTDDGADPALARAKAIPWSIRNMVRYFAANEIDPTEEAAERFLGKKLTLAQKIALKGLSKACAGEMDAIKYSTEQVDGKLPETFEGNPAKPLGTSIVTLRVDSA